LVATQLAPLLVVYEGTELAGAQTAMLRAVTAMLPSPLRLVEAPEGRVANVAQLLPPSPDQ